jgi:hypothetical protein
MKPAKAPFKGLALGAGVAAAAPAFAQVTTINPPAPVANGKFAIYTAPLGDIDNDLRSEFLIGAPQEGVNNSGRVHIGWGVLGTVMSGKSMNAPHPIAGARFGEAVAGVPSVNGDTTPDILVGAPGVTIGAAPAGSGRVYVFSGSNSTLIRTIQSPAMELNGNFGNAVAGLPDINADLKGDIVVGALFEDPGTSPFNCGRVYVYSGATGQLLRKIGSPTPQEKGKFGTSVSGVPDLNGDNVADILVGSQEFNGQGRVHIYSGATFARLRTIHSPGAETGGVFGWSVSGIPDVNGDARGDILVGAPHEDPGTSPTSCGRAYIYSGATGQLLWKLLPLTPEAQGRFGWSVAGIPDTNNDGRGDAIVGAPGEDPGASPTDAGRAYVHSGATGLRLSTLTSVSEAAAGGFGSSVSGITDVNGNARAEVVVGAPGELLAGINAGRGFLIRR